MVDKTMMGDKCAELVRAAMIGALAVTLGNPTAVYAAEEETADPGQIGIEIAGEAAVGAASFCVEEDAAELTLVQVIQSLRKNIIITINVYSVNVQNNVLTYQLMH